MGEAKKRALQVDFDPQVKVEFHGKKTASDVGLLAYREWVKMARADYESQFTCAIPGLRRDGERSGR